MTQTRRQRLPVDAEQMLGCAVQHADGATRAERKQQQLDRMLAKLGQRGEYLGRMVQLVELPQHRDTMHQPVREPVAEIEHDPVEHRHQTVIVMLAAAACGAGAIAYPSNHWIEALARGSPRRCRECRAH